MFKIIGALVVYGFALYGLARVLEESPALSNVGRPDTLTAPAATLSVVK